MEIAIDFNQTEGKAQTLTVDGQPKEIYSKQGESGIASPYFVEAVAFLPAFLFIKKSP